MHECQHSRLLWFRFGLPRAAGTQHFSEALEDAMELNAMSLRPLIRKVSVCMGRRIEFQKWTHFQASSSYGNDACKLYLGNPMHRKWSLSQSFQIAPTTCMQLGTVTRKSVLPKKWSPKPILAAKNGPPGPPLVAKNGPISPKLVLAGPNLVTKISPRDHFWKLKVVPWTSLGCYEWSCFPILTAEKAE